MSRLDTFHRLLPSLHRAMLDDAHWPAASALIDEAVGATGNVLLVGEGSGDDVRVAFMAGYFRGERRPDLEREYLEDFHPWDERVPRFRKLPDSRLTHVTELYTERELRTSRTYNEFSPRANSRNSLNVRLVAPDGSHVTWAVCDPLRPGGWESARLDTVRRLLPYIRQYVQVRQALAAAQALGSSAAGLLDNTRVGVIHLDRRGRIIESNACAAALLRQGDGLLDRGGLLRARLAANDTRLQRLLGHALPAFPGDPAAGGSTTVRRARGRQSLLVHVSPVAPRHLHLGARRVAALVLVVDPAARPRLSPRRVALTLGLSPAEGRVAALLAEGRTLRDIAALTGYPESRVRSLLKQACASQGVSTHAALVPLVLAAGALPGR